MDGSLLPGPSRSSSLGPVGELHAPGQAEGCVLVAPEPGPAALGTSPFSNGGDGLHRSESVEASANGVCGHCHSGTSFSLSLQVSKLGTAEIACPFLVSG